jgi:hypothetical protein
VEKNLQTFSLVSSLIAQRKEEKCSPNADVFYVLLAQEQTQSEGEIDKLLKS